MRCNATRHETHGLSVEGMIREQPTLSPPRLQICEHSTKIVYIKISSGKESITLMYKTEYCTRPKRAFVHTLMRLTFERTIA